MKTKRTQQTIIILTLITGLVLMNIIAFTSCAAKKGTYKTMSEAPPEPFVVVEEMPMFPGGETALNSYIATNIKYPEAARKEGIEGKVIVKFCINDKGGVERISVLRGVSKELDKEAVRVISTLPEFLPGKQGGVPVYVWYIAPVKFALH